MSWNHFSPIPGHPIGADMDPSALGFPAKFGLAADFDGDKICEILVCPDANGSAGNDMWVMKWNAAIGQWYHLSPIAGHPMQADIDPSALNYPSKFVVAGDFDGDGTKELLICPTANGSAGNDMWVVKYNAGTGQWHHLSPIPGHPMQADIDPSALGFPAKFALAGDFDGDGAEEILICPNANGSAGNDMWVMKFDNAAGQWNHLSPIPGHPMQADIDPSGLNYPAKFAVAGDFDGDGAKEVAICPFAGGSAGNDMWVMKFDNGSGQWNHLSPIAGHPMQADIDPSALNYQSKFVVAGDFDADGADEIAISPYALGSAGNDMWVMKFDKVAVQWNHLYPIPGHPMGADIDPSSLNFPAKFAVTGNFDQSKYDQIAICPDTGGSAGNDFWIMSTEIGLVPQEATFTGNATLMIFPASVTVFGQSRPLKAQYNNPLTLTLEFSGFNYSNITITSFPDIVLSIGSGATTTISLKSGGQGTFDSANKSFEIPVMLSFKSADFLFTDESDISFNLTTGIVSATTPPPSPVTLSLSGSPIDCASGNVTLVGVGTFSGGYLGGGGSPHIATISISGVINPSPC